MTNVEEYVTSLDKSRQDVINRIRDVLKKNLPTGFHEEISYGMIGYVVPLSTYPKGYRDINTPLPYINLASQKNYISLYHMAMSGNSELHSWFVKEYEKLNIGKLDMGVGCIRFKNIDKIPYDLIGQLATKMTVDDMIKLYEESRK